MRRIHRWAKAPVHRRGAERRTGATLRRLLLAGAGAALLFSTAVADSKGKPAPRAIFGDDNVITVARQPTRKHVPVHLIVFDEKYFWHTGPHSTQEIIPASFLRKA